MLEDLTTPPPRQAEPGNFMFLGWKGDAVAETFSTWLHHALPAGAPAGDGHRTEGVRCPNTERQSDSNKIRRSPILADPLRTSPG